MVDLARMNEAAGSRAHEHLDADSAGATKAAATRRKRGVWPRTTGQCRSRSGSAPTARGAHPTASSTQISTTVTAHLS